MNLELARFNMIEQQIRPWKVLDPAVLELLSAVRREDFVPPAHAALAFVDMRVPLLAQGGDDGTCMLEPRIEARLLQTLALRRHEHVLEIGAGSGFMAALMAHQAQEVTTLEVRADLAALASANLKRAGLSRVRVVHADGAQPLPAGGPYHAIVLSGSVAEVPDALLKHLHANGGRLLAIVGHEPIMRARLITRTGEATWTQTDVFDTVAPRLHGFAEPSRFHF